MNAVDKGAPGERPQEHGGPGAPEVRRDCPRLAARQDAGSDTARLSWAEPRDRADQVNGYRIYRKPYVPGDTGRIDQGGSVVLVVNPGTLPRRTRTTAW